MTQLPHASEDTRPQEQTAAASPLGGTAEAVDPLACVRWGRRAASGLVDVAVPVLPAAPLVAGGLALFSAGPEGWGLTLVFCGYLAGLGLGLANTVLRQVRTGQSLGKRLTRTRLVTQTGEPVGTATVLVRTLAHLLDVLSVGVGFLWPLWDTHKQTFADKACRTAVVRA